MATFEFRGVDEPRGAAVKQKRLVLDEVEPPLDLPQLLSLRRQATELLRSDTQFASATAIHTFQIDASSNAERVDATVHRAYLEAAQPTQAASRPAGRS